MKLKEEKVVKEDQTLVNFRVISITGDDPYSLVPTEALEKIRNLVNKESKWAFVNGEYVDVDRLSEKDLLGADDIILTNAVGGGYSGEYKVITRITDKVKNNMVINLDTEHTEITISLAKSKSLPTAKYIRDLTAILTKYLETEAADYVNSVGRKYGVGEPTFLDGGEFEPSFDGTFIVDPDLENDIQIDINHDTNTVIVEVAGPKILEIVHERNIITGAMYMKVTEFVDNEISRAREVANV